MSAGQITQGRRRHEESVGDFPPDLRPGDYWQHGGIWWVYCPAPAEWEFTCAIPKHHVEEHEDGTITVSPSILVRVIWGEQRELRQWHGYLERGIWREV